MSFLRLPPSSQILTCCVSRLCPNLWPSQLPVAKHDGSLHLIDSIRICFECVSGMSEAKCDAKLAVPETKLRVLPVLGAMGFGDGADAAESEAMVAHFAGLGFDVVDTAL